MASFILFSCGLKRATLNTDAANAVSIQCKAEKKSGGYLLDFGHIADEGLVVHVLAKNSQLVQVSDEVLTNPLFPVNTLTCLFELNLL